MELHEAIKLCIENGIDTAFNFLDMMLYSEDSGTFVLEFDKDLFLPKQYTDQFVEREAGFLRKEFQSLDEAVDCFITGSDYLRDVELNDEDTYQDS